MELLDLFWDACFLGLSIAGTIFVIVMRKRFDLWMSLLTCAAWVFKGVRLLYYDLMILALNDAKGNGVVLFMQNAQVALQRVDALVNVLLCAALARLAMIGLYLRWYNKAKRSLDK